MKKKLFHASIINQQSIQAKEILQTVFFPWRLTRLKFQEKSTKKKSTNTKQKPRPFIQ